MTPSTLVEDFKQHRSQYEALTARTEDLLRTLLDVSHIKYHFVESRTKAVESLQQKLQRPGKQYDGGLDDIPDLSAVRVVLYYRDDVDRVGQLIEAEFTVIEQEPRHQPQQYSPDRFGYLSLHYVVSPHARRTSLVEWLVFAKMRTEIHIRTVLQHSWAAASHALQYKREEDVPLDLRRRLFRLAGLFELADEEFVSVRDKASQIAKEVEAAFSNDPQNLAIDSATIRQFVASWNKMDEYKAIARNAGLLVDTVTEVGASIDTSLVGSIVKICEACDIHTIKGLETSITGNFAAFLSGDELAPYKSNEFGPAALLALLLISALYKRLSVEFLESLGWNPEFCRAVFQAAERASS